MSVWVITVDFTNHRPHCKSSPSGGVANRNIIQKECSSIRNQIILVRLTHQREGGMFFRKKCSRCQVKLLVDIELDRKYPQGGLGFYGSGAGDRAMDYLAQQRHELNAAGVTCAQCKKHFCVSCMERFGRAHPTSGGLACIVCGGMMTRFVG